MKIKREEQETHNPIWKFEGKCMNLKREEQKTQNPIWDKRDKPVNRTIEREEQKGKNRNPKPIYPKKTKKKEKGRRKKKKEKGNPRTRYKVNCYAQFTKNQRNIWKNRGDGLIISKQIVKRCQREFIVHNQDSNIWYCTNLIELI